MMFIIMVQPLIRLVMHWFWRFSLLLASISGNLLLAEEAFGGPQRGSTPSGGKSLPILGSSKSMDVSTPYGSHMKPIMDRIKASPDQRTKISSIVESYRSRIQPLRDEYKQKRQEFLTSMTSGGTAETIMTKQVELSHLSSEITSRYCLMRLEIRRQLSPQQILQFEAYARENGWNASR
jgi:hypothetical protein